MLFNSDFIDPVVGAGRRKILVVGAGRSRFSTSQNLILSLCRALVGGLLRLVARTVVAHTALLSFGALRRRCVAEVVVVFGSEPRYSVVTLQTLVRELAVLFEVRLKPSLDRRVHVRDEVVDAVLDAVSVFIRPWTRFEDADLLRVALEV